MRNAEKTGTWRDGKSPFRLCAGLSLGFLAGCTSVPVEPLAAERTSSNQPAQTAKSLSPESPKIPQEAEGGLLPCKGQETVPAPGTEIATAFPNLSELNIDALVHEVLDRNPSLAQMVAAWQAASARYPQVTSLDDPMFGTSAGPAAFGSNSLDGGYRLEISQKYPWHGKLALKGENAQAEARAAFNDVDDMRLQLVESAKIAFYEYYLVDRALGVNSDGLRLLREFKQNAETRYQTGLVPQQDILQAEVEIGESREKKLTLDRMREVVTAKINTLLHLPPDAPLPPPPKEVGQPGPLPDVGVLRDRALARRPDLQAIANRIAAEQAALALAKKEFGPDFEVSAAYDTFWQEKPLRPQVGVRVNLPVRTTRRYGAIAEAQAKISQRQAEFARQTDQVNFQVQEAAAQVRESERAVRLYEAEILRAAKSNVEAASSAYVAGKIPFLALVEAQRKLVSFQDRYYEAVATSFRRHATLERVTGGASAPAVSPSEVPGEAPLSPSP